MNQTVEDAQQAARAAAEAARKAAEAAAAAAAERNVQKARELEARAKSLAEAAAKAAQKANNAAAKLSDALEKLENRGRGDVKLAAAVEKATAAAKAAKASATAAANSAAAATRARSQKPVDRYESMKDRKLELGANPPPASSEKKWHPPMAPPATPPGPGFFSRPPDFLTRPPAPPQPPTPTERLELARERRFEQADRSARPFGEAIPRDLSYGALPRPGTPEIKRGAFYEKSLETPKKTVGGTKLNGGVDVTSEYQRSVKASPPRLQPGSGLTTVTFEVKQERKEEVFTGASVDNGLVVGKAGYKYSQSNELTYELTVPASDARRYQDNPQLAPDPFDVRSLPVGSTLVVKMEDLRGHGVVAEAGRVVGTLPGQKKLGLDAKPDPDATPEEAAQPPINRVFAGGRLETGGADITGRSVAVERVDANTVRLVTGSTEGLKGAFSLSGYVEDEDGLFEATGKAEVEKSFTTQTQKSLELDLRKPGADAVYDYFLKHGQLPPGGGNAAVGSADIYQSSFKNGGKLEGSGRLGSVTGGIAVGTEYGIDHKQTFQDDGAVSSEFTVSNGDRTLQLNRAYKADGTVDPEGTRTHYVVQGAPPEVAEGLQRSFNPVPTSRPVPIQGPQNLELRFTPQDAWTLSHVAKDYVGSWEQRNNQTFNSAAEPLIWALAEAKSPEEAATALMDAGGRHEDYRGLTALSDFYQEGTTHGRRLPGVILVVPAQ
ncbi:hypothetical protein HPC49_37395 [Pyxidicoccus fallax]|uniref:DUF4175 domain-containing protein n=1 Tax=Pyxidicoccus fallax TaxID=394095 RepID=A0A848L6F9_9BACT|nr:hypothetical protein [Pyxidicoccus fallax]NMO14097.1 DUF4175 domain-containing protein [Pyxidicoccus fallax]NPC83877.1 hypothetical protein [Pyxidicoccus fallax]